MQFTQQQQGLLVCALVGALAVTALSPVTGEARRHHSRAQQETTVETTQDNLHVGHTRAVPRYPMARQGSEDMQARLDASLQPGETEPGSYVQVPATVSAYDDAIIGTPLASQEQCVKYLLAANPLPDISVTPQELVSYYYEEGEREGIRPDVAFAQACKETGFFRYGGTVTPDQNNYCGLGTTSATVKGAYFATARLGVRAHIQHLLAYASTRQPGEAIVDPRYQLVRGTYGQATLNRWEDLNGRWAVPGYTYGQSILSMFRAMLRE